MVQRKQKTTVIILAIVICLPTALSVAVAFLSAPSTKGVSAIGGAKYNGILLASETTAELSDRAEVKSVEDTINAIGEVTYPDSKGAIGAAREAYDALSRERKEQVENYDVLTAAEDKYRQLGQEATAKKGLSVGAIAGIVGGSIVGITSIILLVFFLLKKEEKDKK